MNEKDESLMPSWKYFVFLMLILISEIILQLVFQTSFIHLWDKYFDYKRDYSIPYRWIVKL